MCDDYSVLCSYTTKIANFSTFKFNQYDKKLLECYKIKFYMVTTSGFNASKVGIVSDINLETGYVTITSIKRVVDMLNENEVEVMLHRFKEGKTYLSYRTNRIVSINKKKLEMEFIKSLVNNEVNECDI